MFRISGRSAVSGSITAVLLAGLITGCSSAAEADVSQPPAVSSEDAAAEAEAPETDTESTDETAAEDAVAAEAVVEDAAAEEPEAVVASETGSPDSPLPWDAGIVSDEGWSVVFNEIDLDATQRILDERRMVQAPEDGYGYILVNTTMTTPGGRLDLRFEYLTAGGTVISRNRFAELPIPRAYQQLEGGGSALHHNFAFQVPAPSEGVLTVRNAAVRNSPTFYISLR